MWAVLSDIHANLEALDAVLADVAKHRVSHIFCLGDILGYGPDPIACLQKVSDANWDVVLSGFDDVLACYDPDGYSTTGEASLYWLRRTLDSTCPEDLWLFLNTLPHSHTQGDSLFVHGSPRNPRNEYVFPEDIYNHRKMEKIGARINRYSFAGHTHVPGVFVEPEIAGQQWEYVSPQECFDFYRLNGRKTIVNVGAVGQPLDGNWRASYVLVDGWDVIFRRVEYDVDTTVQKIYAIPELDNFLGDRLREGR